MQRDLAVDRGEQPHRRRVVSLQDHPQLRLDGMLGFQEPVPQMLDQQPFGALDRDR
jgi:hypothetical protein